MEWSLESPHSPLCYFLSTFEKFKFHLQRQIVLKSLETLLMQPTSSKKLENSKFFQQYFADFNEVEDANKT